MTERDERLGAALRELDVPQHRVDFERELRRRLEQGRSPRFRWLAIPAAGIAAAAAVAAVVVLLVGLPRSG
ncbi:MAG TPA: hypothetical protein VGJ70_05425, partial [Solirubrobacteraceae bacterium]